MIPRASLAEWRAVVPWSQDHQIEQDFVLARCLYSLLSTPGRGKSRVSEVRELY